MPLPLNTHLSLLGYSRPGDTLQSKPKQAMLVRLSSETLEALESQTGQVQFEFGDNPGIYIGDSHFPMRHQKENAIHELFLRTASATKKNAPLKLHANVIGKFTVEPELAGLRDKLRESTQDAASQRTSTRFIPTPPDIPNPKKRKEPPSMFRKAPRLSDKLAAPQLTTSVSAPSRGTKIPTQSHSSPLRRQIIQFLALGEKTEDQLMKAFEGSDRSLPSRRELENILEQVAEQMITKASSADRTTKVYRLKPTTWKEVRPYEWPTLSDTERTAIARSARIAFQKLSIPENDPIWSHVRFRTPPSTMNPPAEHAQSSIDATSLQRKQDISKRPITSREAKDRKKFKLDARSEIMMKDESLRAAPRPALHDDKSKSLAESRRPTQDSGSVKEATRGQSSQMSRFSKLHVPDSHPPATAVAKSASSRQTDRDSAPLTAVGKSSSIGTNTLPMKAKKKRLEDELSIDESDREKRRPRADERKINAVDRPLDQHAANSFTKRKARDYSAETSHDAISFSHSTKRRRTDYDAVPSASSSGRIKEHTAKEYSSRKTYPDVPASERAAQRSLPTSSTSLRSKREESPPAKQPALRSTSPSETSSRSRISASQSNKPSASKSRRPPVYTSSEDEEPPAPSFRPPGNGSVAAVTQQTRVLHSRNDSTTRVLPTDHAALRERYNKSYAEYLDSFQKLFVQKGMIDDLLKSNDQAGSITDSDGDVGLMDSEELARLTNDHKRLEEELVTIRQIFMPSSRELVTM